MNSQNKIAVFDIDGTLIKGQIQQSLINYLFLEGKIGFFYVVRLNIWFLLYKLRVFKEVKPIFEFGLQYLNGKSVAEIGCIIDDFIIKKLSKQIFTKSLTLIDDLKKDGYSIVILSTAVDPVVSRVSKVFSASQYICTKLEIQNDFYTGKIDGSIMYGKEKLDHLSNFFFLNGYDFAKAIAFADHESDIPMLKIVGKAYVMNPNAHMRRVACREGIGIMDVR